MRFIFSVILSIILLSSSPIVSSAQEFVTTPVEISSEKVRIKGKLFYVHKVMKGQTLYSISKTYEVSSDEITASNPSLSNGLKADMIIYIPIVEVQTEREKTEVETSVPASTSESETKPASVPQNSEGRPTADDNQRYHIHKVKWYESLKDVAEKYGVPIEAIYALNNITPPSKVRIKSVKIPDAEYLAAWASVAAEETPITSSEQSDEDDIEITEGSIEESATAEVPEIDLGEFGSPIKITIVLPFNTAKNSDDLSGYIADFYSGILMGIDHLKEDGLFEEFEVETIDLSEYTSSWEMLSDGVLEGSELIIGPVSSRDLHPIASYCNTNKIPLVSPLDNNTSTLAQGNPYFFLFPPTADNALSRQVEKMAIRVDDSIQESITVLYEKGYDESYLVTETIKELQQRGLPYDTFSYNFMEGREITTSLGESLSEESFNKVIIPSHSEAFISDALRNLHLIQSTGSYQIEVYGMSKWKTMESLDIEHFHQLNLKLSVPYNTDFNDPKTDRFVNGYIAAFNTEPTPFAYQGYDIITFFVDVMNRYNKNFPIKIIGQKWELLQSDVFFISSEPESGAYNKGLKDIQYQQGWIIVEE